jgi:DNA-binding transcriptional MocR family regulator
MDLRRRFPVTHSPRLGYVVVPTEFIGTVERAIHATTWNTPALMTAIATGWLNDGTVMRLEAEKRADARRRQTVARNTLDGSTSSGIRRRFFGFHCLRKPGLTK